MVRRTKKEFKPYNDYVDRPFELKWPTAFPLGELQEAIKETNDYHSREIERLPQQAQAQIEHLLSRSIKQNKVLEIQLNSLDEYERVKPSIRGVFRGMAEFDEVIPPLTVDGVFGPSTANAVQSFQRQTDLLPDGVVGEATWDALYREFASLEAVLQQDVARFPFQASELIPSLVDLTLAAVSGHSETPRFGQHPGTDLRLGQSDQQEVSLS